VLLVEDNPTDVYVIKHVLQSCGLDLDLRIACDGQEALLYLGELAKSGELATSEELATSKTSSGLALVLLDLNTPKVEGIEVLRHLRSSSLFARTPVIIVTSSTAAVDRAAVEHLKAEAYFQKPRTLAAYMHLGALVKQFLRPTGRDPR
jgi:chemotaxis family two-component system response regulator Rcp1